MIKVSHINLSDNVKETSGAQTHMSLQVDLSRMKNHVQIINDRRHHRVFGKKAYVQVDFVIKANIGLAEANFQCCKKTAKCTSPRCSH